MKNLPDCSAHESSERYWATNPRPQQKRTTKAVHPARTLDPYRYSRGKLTILDPQGWEVASCECYRTLKWVSRICLFERLAKESTP